MAQKSITLPSGAKVVLKDPKDLKQKDRVRIYNANGDDSQPTLQRGIAMMTTIISVLIDSWDLELVPPSVSIDSLDELSIADFDALQDEAEAAMPILFPKLNKDIEAELDPKAPTANSNG